MVDIYLKVDAVDGSDDFLPFLSIPLSDIQRLTIRPLKWLRFVAFAICGSRGHLRESITTTIPVDYNNSNLVESSTYYYIPEQPCAFINHHGLNDQITSSELTPRRWDFREHVMLRDGECCVLTAYEKELCEAVHIIPRSKGTEYIHRVIQDRSHLYDTPPVLDRSGIDDIQNGIFMHTTLHLLFAQGSVAFLKTSNFALNSDDILRVGQGPIPPNPITLQHLKPQEALYGRFPDSMNANFRGTEGLLPPALLLDYMYGVAAYNRWKVKDIHPVVDQYFADNYESIPLPPPAESSGSDGHHNSRGWVRLEEAMENMNTFIMRTKGITPQVLQAEEEKKQAMEKEESRVKVEGWLQWVPVGEQPEGA